MRNIILCTILAILFSCKKDNHLQVENDNKVEKIVNNNELNIPLGDSLISKSNFVNQINNNNSIKSQREYLSKINYDYDKFCLLTKDRILSSKKNFTFRLNNNINNNNTNADIFKSISLCIYSNNSLVDSLVIYKQENYGEALVAKTQYFYLNASLNLWTLSITEEEEGIKVTSWNYYKIDEKGKINLLKEDFIQKKILVTNSNWIGKYFFEKTNRDELKTSFEIFIKDLNLITLKYISDSDQTENYMNLVGDKVADNKIRIVFNKKYGNMGVIYIENYEGNYLISGTPISIINPGNDEFPIIKIK
ncbi:hypothetical protein ACFSX9_01335 [Flavobacterium ardleyense]|uniref:Lipoprotein n=1 Tax=Flavobacterium ardleyense TaxID=2038737 RepID=A0ABW5Z3F9_9FLAO